MYSCLSGGGRAYGFDIEIIKSPSTTSSITSHSSSPSSILSESSNSPTAISTRKPRTRRKRPNQTYNEAAALLSTANPKIFSAKQFTNKYNPCKFTKFHNNPFLDDSLIDNSGFLLHQPIREKPNSRIELKVVNSSSGKNPVENEFQGNWNSLNVGDGYQEDFDTESMLDEDIEEGIDSIMGNLSVNNESFDEGNHNNTCYGYPIGLGFSGSFDFGFGMRRGVRALRQVDEEEDWWRFPTVNVAGKFKKESAQKKKKKKVEKPVELKKSSESDSPPRRNSIPEETKAGSIPESGSGLLLKLNYDKVLNAWSDRGSPFPDEILGSGSGSGSESCGNDIHARLAQIDLFSEGGGLREASVMRYKEKRRTRLFSKKIRYQVRKVNADRRPRMKGRFVRRPNSPMSGH